MRFQIDKKEFLDLFIAALLISFIVVFNSFSDVLKISFYKTLGIAFIVLSLSFILHELAHKFMAIRYGMFAQFEISYYGLVFSLLFKIIFGITIIVPGAVMIYRNFFHRSRKKDIALQGIISISGPIVNMILSALGYILYLLSIFKEISYLLAYVNALLLVFNLLPVPPLDGFKVARWSLLVYIPLIILSIIWFIFIS